MAQRYSRYFKLQLQFVSVTHGTCCSLKIITNYWGWLSKMSKRGYALVGACYLRFSFRMGALLGALRKIMRNFRFLLRAKNGGKSRRNVVPNVGIELTTYRLQGGCSTPELIRLLLVFIFIIRLN